MGTPRLEQTKSPTEAWGNDHHENETIAIISWANTERWSLTVQDRTGFKSCSLVVCNVSSVRRTNCSIIRVFEAVAMVFFQVGHDFMHELTRYGSLTG